jgi:hypothetical protein
MSATNDPTIFYIGIALAVIILAAIIVMVVRRTRSAAIQRRFGPEYDRTVRQTGSRSEAERELAEREARVKKMHIQDLPDGAKSRYIDEWHTVQAEFVDNPPRALQQADGLLTNVMRDRGYPMSDFERRAADLSTDHPEVIQHYRAAHAIARRSRDGQASTEDLRQAMIHYRFLFDELVGAHERQLS